jgi:hypothetical protein
MVAERRNVDLLAPQHGQKHFAFFGAHQFSIYRHGNHWFLLRHLDRIMLADSHARAALFAEFLIDNMRFLFLAGDCMISASRNACQATSA